MNKLFLRKIIKEEYQKILNEAKAYTDSEISSLEKEFEKYEKELVPRSGKADTIEGEMLRAISRIVYRYYNDGDVFFYGYGKETALPSVNWLLKSSPLKKELKPHFDLAKTVIMVRTKYGKQVGPVVAYTEDDDYRNGIYGAAEEILNYIKSKNGNYTPNETEDSR